MSPGGRAEGMARLRRVIPEIETEAGSAAGLPASGRPARRLPLASAFDSALSGGLADDALHEIVPAEPADGAAAMGFALALAARFLSLRPASALIIGEGFAAGESGALYGPGLAAHGLILNRLVFVRAPDAALAFWAIEEALKCGAPAVVIGEIWSLKAYGLAASRRLLLAARKGGTPALLVLASAYGQANRVSSAAETRFEIAAAPSARTPAASGPDLPGPFACGARLVKARLGTFAGDLRAQLNAHDPGRIVRLEWRSQDTTFQDMTFQDAAFQDTRFKDAGFDDPAISLPLAAASGDRPRAAARLR
jgi:protein ImuA